jgi:Lrp/AsnC family transcriptional regulator for asnA, asnC and gidA
LDGIDTKIVNLLQKNGRRPGTEIARLLGVTEGTVRKRIDRLLRDGVIQIAAVADPMKIGYQTYAIIRIQVNPPDLEKVARRLAIFDEVFFLGIASGDADIVAAALFRSNEHMYQFFTRRLTRVPGIQRSSTLNLMRIVKREYAYPVANDGDDLPSRGPVRGRRTLQRVERGVVSSDGESRAGND